MILGNGLYQYEWQGDWMKLPASIRLGYTHGVVTDSSDNVYVHNTSDHALCVFDREGKFITSWGKEFEGGAHGMFLSREGNEEFLYFADTRRRLIVKTTLDGRELFTLGHPPRTDIYDKPEKFTPTDVCVAPNGDFYVMDGYGQPYVHRYDRNAEYLGTFGGPGNAPGQLKCPHGGWVVLRNGAEAAELYIADRGNNRIQVFTLDGRHKRFITDEMRQPCCFFEHKGDLYIPDLLSRITILDQNDKLVAHLGQADEMNKTPNWPNIQYKIQPGKFSAPHAVCVDSHDDIYVAEWISSGRLTRLKRQK